MSILEFGSTRRIPGFVRGVGYVGLLEYPGSGNVSSGRTQTNNVRAAPQPERPLSLT